MNHLKSPAKPPSLLQNSLGNGWSVSIQYGPDSVGVTLLNPSGSQFHFVADANNHVFEVVPGNVTRIVSGNLTEVVCGNKSETVKGNTLLRSEGYLALDGVTHINHPHVKNKEVDELPARLPVARRLILVDHKGNPIYA